MKTRIIQFLIPLCCVALFSSFVGRDPQWFERRMGELEKTMQIQNEEEKIKKLGGFLGIGLHGGMDVEQQQIFDKAQVTLLSIPGHAKYYQDKIESLKAQVLADAKISSDEEAKRQQAGNPVVYLADYDSYREKSILMLEMLPSSETVSVLGDYLDDPVGRDHKNLLGQLIPGGQDYNPALPNADYAAMAIRKLGIEHPPFQAPHSNPNEGIFDGEVDAWKDWWNEVKEGRRTYRFIGSNVQYGPDGPASKEVIQRVERDRKRVDERALRQKRSLSSSKSTTGITQISQPTSIVWLVAAIGLCAAAVWYFLRSRKTVP